MDGSSLRSRLHGLAQQVVATLRSSFWLRPTLFSIVALATVLAVVVAPIPSGWLDAIPLPLPEFDELGSLFRLVAGSSLTIATVSLSVIMLLLNMVGSQGSPRALPELMADKVVQSALGAFVGTFVFGVAGLLATGFPLAKERSAILLLLGVLAALFLLRWLVHLITHVTDLLKLGRLVERVHRSAARALARCFADGDAAAAGASVAFLGIAEGELVHHRQSGFLVLVDREALAALAARRGLVIDILLREGEFASPLRPVARIDRLDRLETRQREEVLRQLRAALTIAQERIATRDPVFALGLLAEIAARALSPGVNDPGTALVCLEYAGDLLARGASRGPAQWAPDVVASGRVRLRRPDFPLLLDAGTTWIARHGADNLDVIGPVTEMLGRLARLAHPVWRGAIEEQLLRVAELARKKLPTDAERRRFDTLAARALDACRSEGRLVADPLGG
ncbi:DUF2254 family protein [Geminicoccaceae bacterium 1502E]|nr:DUF2254 family protein [Geminicoccaceae bacterium 1502E]